MYSSSSEEREQKFSTLHQIFFWWDGGLQGWLRQVYPLIPFTYKKKKFTKTRACGSLAKGPRSIPLYRRFLGGLLAAVLSVLVLFSPSPSVLLLLARHDLSPRDGVGEDQGREPDRRDGRWAPPLLPAISPFQPSPLLLPPLPRSMRFYLSRWINMFIIIWYCEVFKSLVTIISFLFDGVEWHTEVRV